MAIIKTFTSRKNIYGVPMVLERCDDVYFFYWKPRAGEKPEVFSCNEGDKKKVQTRLKNLIERLTPFCIVQGRKEDKTELEILKEVATALEDM